MASPVNIRVSAPIPFPALVRGTGLITVTKLNGIWTIASSPVNLATSAVTGVLPVANGGTAGNTPATARTALFAAPFDAAAYYGLGMNPGHEVSQANVDAAVSIAPGGGSVNPYLTDMHKVFAQGTFTATGQRVTDAPPGFSYSEKITITGTQAVLGVADIFHLNHFVEGWRIARLALGTANAAPITVVYLVKPSLANQVINLSVANAGTENRNWISKFTLTANVWNFISTTTTPETTGTWATQTTASLVTTLCLGAGSSYFGTPGIWNTGVTQDATSDVTNMMATNGATFQYIGPFIFPGTQVPDVTMLPNLVVPQMDALARCERYYWKSFQLGTVPAQNVGNGTGEFTFPAIQPGATAQKSSVFELPVRMRLNSPTTMTLYNPAAANAQVRDKGAAADCSGTAGAADEQYWFVACTGNAGTAIANSLAIHATLDHRM